MEFFRMLLEGYFIFCNDHILGFLFWASPFPLPLHTIFSNINFQIIILITRLVIIVLNRDHKFVWFDALPQVDKCQHFFMEIVEGGGWKMIAVIGSLRDNYRIDIIF